jgi:hypothetical protein
MRQGNAAVSLLLKMSISRSVTAPPDSRAPTPQPSTAGTPATPVGVTGPITVSLKLGENGFSFANGKWIPVAPQTDGPSQREMVEAAELERLKKELDDVRARADAVEQERNLLVFKNKLLTEMVRRFVVRYFGASPMMALHKKITFITVGCVATGLQEKRRRIDDRTHAGGSIEVAADHGTS